jgi:hypothetical protein
LIHIFTGYLASSDLWLKRVATRQGESMIGRHAPSPPLLASMMGTHPFRSAPAQIFYLGGLAILRNPPTADDGLLFLISVRRHHVPAVPASNPEADKALLQLGQDRWKFFNMSNARMTSCSSSSHSCVTIDVPPAFGWMGDKVTGFCVSVSTFLVLSSSAIVGVFSPNDGNGGVGSGVVGSDMLT